MRIGRLAQEPSDDLVGYLAWRDGLPADRTPTIQTAPNPCLIVREHEEAAGGKTVAHERAQISLRGSFSLELLCLVYGGLSSPGPETAKMRPE